jgi:solute carrier family 8 (sodium/calcium exchanger)
MLVILGICVMCIPTKNEDTGETGTRKIADMNVFGITAFSSVFAYVWLLVILMMVTPNVVDLWESLLTFLFFPILVALAYMADAGFFSKRNKVGPESNVTGVMSDGVNLGTFRPNEVKSLLKAEGHRDVLTTDPEELEKLAEAAYYKSKPKTRADYRIEATRELTGSKPRAPEGLLGDGDGKARRSWIGWQCTNIKVSEADAYAECIVERSGNLTYPVTFKVETSSGTATAGEDFQPVSQTLTLKANEDTVSCKIPIKSDNQDEKDEHFVVTISEPSEKDVEIESARTECSITIVDDSTPPVLQMAETEEEGLTASYKCYESDGRVLVKVVRTGGCGSAVSCQFTTKEGTATANMDYKETSGTLEFGPGETSKFIDIEIIDDDQFETDEDFTVTISDPVGATLGGIKTATVTIVNDDEMTDVVERVSALLKINMDKYKVGSASYSKQFKDAVDMPEETGDKIAHFLNLPFKLIFAICPPPGICGGWLCFSISLLLIGVTTAVIGDLAALFGCAVGMKDAVTAITFVALGTSLPDTFASKAAAIGDKTADSSVGNVTGSNSVNVFLGLGLPWLMASVYWGSTTTEKENWEAYLLELPDSMLNPDQYEAILKLPCGGEGGCFVVPAGDLGFSVIIFGICAVLCLGGMVLRRSLYGYELGGKASTPFGVFFILLWFFYVVMSTMKSYAII